MNAPFGRTGGKYKSYKRIIDLFPEHTRYAEIFGGSGVVLLNKPRVGNEMFNDIEGGLIAFYRCIQDPDLLKRLSAKLEVTVHSRDFWYWCKDSTGVDLVDKAFKWFYVTRFSFGQQGRAFGRTLGKQNGDANKILSTLKDLPEIHQRLKGVTIENLGFRRLMDEYDHEDTLFYLDPPYQDTFQYIYEHRFSDEDHKDLLRLIQNCKGRVALSGYANSLYDSVDWTDRVTWEQNVPVRGSYREDGTHDKAEEVLWLK